MAQRWRRRGRALGARCALGSGTPWSAVGIRCGDEPAPIPLTPVPEVSAELLAEAQAVRDSLTPKERARLDQYITYRKRHDAGEVRTPLTLRQFIDQVSGGRFQWYRYAITLCAVLQRVADGVLSRVMIFAPPRHGKSELVSRWLPAYFLYRYPERWVTLCSATATLANGLSRNARSHYFRFRQELETGSVREWLTTQGGGMRAAGVGGQILGTGFHLGIIDDPLKNAAQATSLATREVQREWWQSTFYTRTEPGASIVIIMQRWNREDLAGWILQQEEIEASADGGAPEHWHIVNFEAIKTHPAERAKQEQEEGEPWFPSSTTEEPDWRQPGEALNPERYPLEDLLRRKRRVGAYYWASLFQQRPRPRSGLMFNVEALITVDRAEVPLHRLILVRYWDHAAAQDGDADFTAGFLIGFDPLHAKTGGRMFYLIDLRHGRWAPDKRNRELFETTKADIVMYVNGHGEDERLTTWEEQQPGSAGVERAINFRRLLASLAARCFTDVVTGSSTDRAYPFAAAVSAGAVCIVRAPWNGVARRELADFPRGAHDDVVTSGSGAFNKLGRWQVYEENELPPSTSRPPGR